MVLVFKTSVKRKKDAKLLIQKLNVWKDVKINFDLEDCDKILRVEGKICNAQIIIKNVKDLGFHIEEL